MYDVVGVETGIWVDDHGFESLQEEAIFVLYKMFRSFLGQTRPPVQWFHGVLSLGKTVGA
jgi:hypothetical protein